MGAGVGLVLDVVNGIDAARQVKGQLAYAPSPCPAETGAPLAIGAPPPVAFETVEIGREAAATAP